MGQPKAQNSAESPTHNHVQRCIGDSPQAHRLEYPGFTQCRGKLGADVMVAQRVVLFGDFVVENTTVGVSVITAHAAAPKHKTEHGRLVIETLCTSNKADR